MLRRDGGRKGYGLRNREQNREFRIGEQRVGREKQKGKQRDRGDRIVEIEITWRERKLHKSEKVWNGEH